MRTFCSVHTHSVMCDGENTLEEMAKAAFEAGAVSFGASGHSHTPIPCDAGNVLPPDPAAYRAEVLRLREVYRGRMDVLLGIEQDSCADGPVPDWADYWIGSVHNLPGSGGAYYAVDWDESRFQAAVEALSPGDVLGLAERYYDAVAETARQKPAILGHIDLITKFNEGGRFFDEAAPRYRDAALAALRAADPAATLLEVNTGAMSRGWRTGPCPALFLLEAWRDMGGRIILTADAHSAETIVYGYGQAAELAGAAGFDRAAVLTAGGIVEQPL